MLKPVKQQILVKQTGLSMIEFMIVLAIVGMVVSLILPNYLAFKSDIQARDIAIKILTEQALSDEEAEMYKGDGVVKEKIMQYLENKNHEPVKKQKENTTTETITYNDCRCECDCKCD